MHPPRKQPHRAARDKGKAKLPVTPKKTSAPLLSRQTTRGHHDEELTPEAIDAFLRAKHSDYLPSSSSLEPAAGDTSVAEVEQGLFDEPLTPVDLDNDTEPGDAPEPFGDPFDPNDPDDPDDPNDPFGGGNVPNVPMANPAPPPAINYDPQVFDQGSLLKAFEKVPELKDAESYGLFKRMTRLVLDTGKLDVHLRGTPDKAADIDGWTMNQCIMMSMLSKMSNVVAANYIQYTTVQDMWNALEAQYNMQMSTQTAVSIADLFHFRASLPKFVDNLDKMVQIHSRLTVNGDTPTDKVMVSAINAMTPDQYKHVVATYEGKNSIWNEVNPAGPKREVKPFE